MQNFGYIEIQTQNHRPSPHQLFQRRRVALHRRHEDDAGVREQMFKEFSHAPMVRRMLTFAQAAGTLA
jgi:hypothetical protein